MKEGFIAANVIDDLVFAQVTDGSLNFCPELWLTHLGNAI